MQRDVQTIVNPKTIVDHCPQNFENHRKTIGSNGWTPQKTFNGDGPTLSKPLKNHWRQWWPKKKTLTIPSPWKIDHRCGLVAIESSYFSVCQHVRVQISNSSASVVALTAFVRHLPHVRPHLYLKTWCVYAREVLVTFVCLFTSMCHLVFLQLMYILVCKSYHIGQTLSNT